MGFSRIEQSANKLHMYAKHYANKFDKFYEHGKAIYEKVKPAIAAAGGGVVVAALDTAKNVYESLREEAIKKNNMLENATAKPDMKYAKMVNPKRTSKFKGLLN